MTGRPHVSAAAFIALLLAAPLAAAHPADDACSFDRWACARRDQPPPDPPTSPNDNIDEAAAEDAEADSPLGAPQSQPEAPRPALAPTPAPAATSSLDSAAQVIPGRAATTAPRAEHDAPREDRPILQTISLYLKLGYLHILPKGLDHILFVLALFLASTRMRALVVQISTFTLAHTLTLALAALGIISAPANIVEPLIALSIAFVAVENIAFKDMTAWRPLVVFGFGLFHGLGFAGVLGELGLPNAHFAAALVSFNVGVELGQLSVIALALAPALMLRRLLKREGALRLYRPIAVIPASLCIAVVGAAWAFQRAFLA